MPDGLAAFIAERLDEAEQNISHAGPARIAWLSINDDAGEFRYTTVAAGDDNSPWCADGREIPRPASVRVIWDPARELRGIAAKHAILAEHQASDHEHDGRRICLRCVNPSDLAAAGPFRWQVPYPCPTVRQLGTEWNDHPAYLPEWSPEPATAP